MTSSSALVTVLISSFQGYSDAWPGVIHGLNKYWPDCPWPIYLTTDAGELKDDRIRLMVVEGGKDWSTGLLNAVRSIQTPYVMYFQEDYWIMAPVDTQKMETYVDHLEKHGLNYLRLVPHPEPDEPFPPDPRLGYLAGGAAYRTSLQISFWRRTMLEGLLVPGESPWQFEINGTERSRKHGRTFLSTCRYGDDEYFHGIRYLCTAINAGKWYRPAHDYAEKEKVEIDFSRRPTETLWEHYRRTSPWGRATGRLLQRAERALKDPASAMQRIRRGRS